MELGRRDGLSSTSDSVEGRLPHPTDDVNQLTTLFAKNGLSRNDMIALSGKILLIGTKLISSSGEYLGLV